MTETDRREAGELISELREKEQSLTCGEEAAERYRSIHERRFSKTFSLCVELAPDPQIRVLDIGPSHLTHLLAGRYKNITALGFAPSSDRGGHVDKPVAAPGIRQIVFDLNLSQFPDRWPATDRLFDLIVYAETIEHLQIPPEYSLLFPECSEHHETAYTYAERKESF
jgi:cyclopropane fatty-acyl-phospholipid synthase-like methyltransferase